MVNYSSGAARQIELIPPILCPAVFSHSLSYFHPFLFGVYLSNLAPFYPFQTHHSPISSLSHPPCLYFSNSSEVSSPISIYVFPSDKALVEEGKYQTGNWNVQEVSYLTGFNMETHTLHTPHLQMHTFTLI